MAILFFFFSSRISFARLSAFFQLLDFSSLCFNVQDCDPLSKMARALVQSFVWVLLSATVFRERKAVSENNTSSLFQ